MFCYTASTVHPLNIGLIEDKPCREAIPFSEAVTKAKTFITGCVAFGGSDIIILILQLSVCLSVT